MEKSKNKNTNECELKLTCNFCSSILEPDNSNQDFGDKCPICKKFLPKCSICFYPIQINEKNFISPLKNKLDKSNINNINIKNNKNNKNYEFVCCTKCKHGGHINHYIEWFNEYKICPFFKCDCLCVDE